MAAGLLALGLPAQQVRVVAPVGGVVPAATADEDHGVPVEMFENPNLDRYLRRAQSFLDQQKYDAAIQVLQDVIEGRTIEFVDAPKDEPAEAKPTAADQVGERRTAGSAAADSKVAPKPAPVRKGPTDLDAAQSVFSLDGRVYRPVRRLCHEILARLPEVGIELYRTAYEVAANELLDQALGDGSTLTLERVANRYFVTVPAGKAMVALADRLMHEGRYRAAVQVLRDLVEVYPVANRGRAGVDELWCRFKIALCLRLAGETAEAHATAIDLATRFPEESLRVLGELQSVKDLPGSAMFVDEVRSRLAAPASTGIGWLAADTESLVPLWQYRFRNAEPYKEPKSTNTDNNVFFGGEGAQITTMPHAGRYGAGTWVTFAAKDPARPPQAMFLEHFCLRVADTLSGLQLLEGDGVVEPPQPRENYPRVRIAAVDQALLRPVDDGHRCYVVTGYKGSNTQSADVLKSTEVIAYQRDTLQPAWKSSQWLDGEDGLREVIFLAAPTVFGERLLVPSLRRGAYSLTCLDRSSGRPLWHTALHGGGTSFFKAPGVPVVVQGGIAYIATNAGCVAAVDAFAGDLRWIRRYERDDPLRPKRGPKKANGEGVQYGVLFQPGDIPGFHPGELIVSDGLLVVGPCDGSALVCIDGANGKVAWLLDGASRFAPFGTLRAVVGANATDLFVLAERHLVCIGLRGGLVRWMQELPTWNGPKTLGRGRGLVTDSAVVIPGERELLVFDARHEAPLRRLRLQPFGVGREPLPGSFHVSSAGPWLAIGYPGGVELFSSASALRQLAAACDDVQLRTNYLVHAGDHGAAEDLLRTQLADVGLDAALRPRLAGLLLALVRERALAAARAGDGAAVAQLDSLEPFTVDRTVRLNWHLARLEVCKEAGDLRGHEQEQQRLYDYMEGKQSR